MSVRLRPADLDGHRARASPAPRLAARARGSLGRGSTLEIATGQVAEDSLLVFAQRVGAGGIVVPKRGWFRNGPGREFSAVFLLRRPRAMRRLVVAHDKERLVLRPVAERLDRQFGDDVGGVAAGVRFLPAGGVENRVVVRALARQDFPAIEARRIAPEMPFADHRRCGTPPPASAWPPSVCEPSKRLKTGTPLRWLNIVRSAAWPGSACRSSW